MKFLFIIISLLCCTHSLFAQDSTITISANMVNTQNPFYITVITGWVYHSGNNPEYALPVYNTAGWKSLKPSNITKSVADKDGNVEGWFRIRILPDSSFADNSLNLVFSYVGGSEEVYIDGKLVGSYGKTNSRQKSFQKVNTVIPLIPGIIESGKPFIIAIHYKNKLPAWPDIQLVGAGIYNTLDNYFFYGLLWLITCAVLSLLFWMLAFQNRKEKILWLIAACATFFTISAYTYYAENVMMPVYLSFYALVVVEILSRYLVLLFLIVVVARIFDNKLSWLAKSYFIVSFILLVPSIFGIYFSPMVSNIINFSGLIFVLYYVLINLRKIKSAQLAIVLGTISVFAFGAIYFTQKDRSNTNSLLILSVVFLSFPVSLLIYVSIRFKEIINEVRENAARLMQVTEEKRQQALNQQEVLQEEVNRQTADLRTTLNNLKSTQAQLIQSEKMASLGELTAGIAHEIQNPLNFVNNFSEVSTELIDEMTAELDKGDITEAKEIASDLKQNLEKINHHGKRAGDIVKGMLQHSRTSTGVKEPTNINALADEYLRLSYHGLRAKDKDFNATMKTDFDESIRKINIIPQDIGRVLLNLFNNAFYAVNEHASTGSAGQTYEPTVTVTTKKSDNHVIITVSDNGNGIPQKVVDKIFQPFFTTKPTGQGTGLGLSLSYDIIKAHGGEIKVESKQREGSTFIIQIPVV